MSAGLKPGAGWAPPARNGRLPASRRRENAMATPTDQDNPDFRRGWDAAIRAAQSWHEAKAKQAMVQSRRTRFPKNLEREAEFHKHAAEMMPTLSPDDV